MKKFLNEIKDNHIIPLQNHSRDNSDAGIEEQISELKQNIAIRVAKLPVPIWIIAPIDTPITPKRVKKY